MGRDAWKFNYSLLSTPDYLFLTNELTTEENIKSAVPNDNLEYFENDSNKWS